MATALLAIAPTPAGVSADTCGTYVVGTGTGCSNYGFSCCGLRTMTCDGAVLDEFCTAACAPGWLTRPEGECQGGVIRGVDCNLPEEDSECGDTGPAVSCGSFPQDCEPEPSDGGPSGCGGGQGRQDTESRKDTEGTDPIHLSTKSAITEPFLDFQLDGLTTIKLERTYSSADTSVPKPGIRLGRTVGIFGRGWHHNWEAYLTCSTLTVETKRCTLVRGLKSQKIFIWRQGNTVTVNGETWDYFTRQGLEAPLDGDQDLLIRKVSSIGAQPSFVIFGVDGTELHFQQYPVTDTANCAFGDNIPRAGRSSQTRRLSKASGPRGGRTPQSTSPTRTAMRSSRSARGCAQGPARGRDAMRNAMRAS